MASLASFTSTEDKSLVQSISSPSQRPSYFDYSSTTGLYPPQHTFDEGIIKRLDPELFDETLSTQNNSQISEDEKLKTFLRIRPNTNHMNAAVESSLEVKDERTVVAYTNPRVNAHPNDRERKQTEFKFSKILGPECGQSTVFDQCVTPIIDHFFRHENCLIFSYGATNSGKTYTMQGHGTEYGIIPRTLDSIFSRIHDRQYRGGGNIRPALYNSCHVLSHQESELLNEKRKKIISDANIKQELMSSYRLTTSTYSDRSGSTVDIVAGHNYDPNTMFTNTTLYSLWVSYAELYNERVYDLLDCSTISKNKRRKELKLMQDRNGYSYIKDLTELPVTSDEEAYKLFLAGRKNLQFAATQMNQHSSRSHSFFTIRVVTLGIGEGGVPFPKNIHRMTFCDLAGMERANQTENRGFRLHESGNINNSLTVLLKVIRMLRAKQAQNAQIETVPFRESKLTHIFKSYLTSATHICMIVNVNPDPSVAESTLQVLQNSAIASNVIVFRPIDINVQVDPETWGNIRAIASKPPLPPNWQRKKGDGAKEKRPLELTESESSDADDEYGAQTVVAPKTLLQKMKILETENMRLKMLLVQKEAEINKMRDDMMSLMAEERVQWMKKIREIKHTEDIFSKRRLSLIQTQLSPGSKCGRCRPPTRDMEDIDETFEEEEEDIDEESSDKENRQC